MSIRRDFSSCTLTYGAKVEMHLAYLDGRARDARLDAKQRGDIARRIRRIKQFQRELKSLLSDLGSGDA